MISARLSGSGSKHLCMRFRQVLDNFTPGISASMILPSMASLSVGNGDIPVKRYDSKTPRVQTSAGGA